MIQNNVNHERKFFRVYFETVPLLSELTIENIQGKPVKARKTLVQVNDISADGLQFVSDLKLPIHVDHHIGFSLNIERRNLYLSGVLMNCNSLPDKKYEYEAKFTSLNKKEQQELFHLLNKLQADIRGGYLNYSKYTVSRLKEKRP